MSIKRGLVQNIVARYFKMFNVTYGKWYKMLTDRSTPHLKMSLTTDEVYANSSQGNQAAFHGRHADDMNV